MPTITFHIGLHKTGTTAFQVAMAAARERLAEEGFVYPDRKANHSDDLYTMFSSRAASYLPNVVAGRTGDALDAYRAECLEAWRSILVSAREDDHIIVSGEDISLLKEEGWRALRDFFAPHARSLNALAIVREPVAWARSSLQQSLKGGKPWADGASGALHQQVEQRLRPVCEVLGRDRIAVRTYDELAASPEGLVAALGEACGLPTSIAESLTPEERNLPLSREGSLLLSALNETTDFLKDAPGREHRMRGDFSAFAGIPGERFPLTDEQQKRVLEKWPQDQAFLEATFGIKLPAQAQETVSAIDQTIADHEAFAEIGKRLARGAIDAKRRKKLEKQVARLTALRDRQRKRLMLFLWLIIINAAVAAAALLLAFFR